MIAVAHHLQRHCDVVGHAADGQATRHLDVRRRAVVGHPRQIDVLGDLELGLRVRARGEDGVADVDVALGDVRGQRRHVDDEFARTKHVVCDLEGARHIVRRPRRRALAAWQQLVEREAHGRARARARPRHLPGAVAVRGRRLDVGGVDATGAHALRRDHAVQNGSDDDDRQRDHRHRDQRHDRLLHARIHTRHGIPSVLGGPHRLARRPHQRLSGNAPARAP